MELLLPPNLLSQEIEQCPELQELPLLPPSLVSFQIIEVNWTKLPRMGKLCIESDRTRLSNVSIIYCPCLSSLEDSFFEQKQHMVALRNLRIDSCIHLESASIPFEAMNSLTFLDILDCPKLRALRGAGQKFLPSSLQHLLIRSCGDYERTLFGSLQEQQLTNLFMLCLKNCSNLVSLPSAEAFSNLTSLKNISIEGCENLSTLGGLGSLQSLSELTIRCCAKLIKFGSSVNPYASACEEEHLVDSRSSLYISRLTIDLPSLLLVDPLKSLCHTECLVIEDASQMESLPDCSLLQNSSSLKSLIICTVKTLELLPLSMRDLTSLQYLKLSGVDQLLGSLPELPTSLLELDIWRCGSEWEKKFRKHGIPERNKIAHILRVRIGISTFNTHILACFEACLLDVIVNSLLFVTLFTYYRLLTVKSMMQCP